MQHSLLIDNWTLQNVGELLRYGLDGESADDSVLRKVGKISALRKRQQTQSSSKLHGRLSNSSRGFSLLAFQNFRQQAQRAVGLKFFEIKIVAADAEVVNDVSDDAARHVARMPCKRDEAVGAERIGIVPMAAGGAKEFTADLAQSAFKLAAVP
jgi:hypothetical protein